MIERFLYVTVQQGMEVLRDDPQLMRDIFSQYDLPEDELDAIETLMTTKFPLVKHQYARLDDDPPIISIVLSSEEESEHYLEDFAVQNDDGSDIKSAIWNHRYDVLVYTEHPDHTLYLYQMLKAIFVTAPLYNYGLFETQLSGQDLVPDARYIPENLFARKLTFQAQKEFESLDRLAALGKAFAVRGIHIDKSGSPSDVGGVKTLVGTYQAGEEDDG